jgi:hypothetical protein
VLGTEVLSTAGGDPIQLVITCGFDPLTKQLGVGMLDTGVRLGPETVRRLACDATVLPRSWAGRVRSSTSAGNGGSSHGAIRRALVLRDGGCAFPSCDRPPTWCQGHHMISWLDGGPTDLDNGVLLCGHHHRLIHIGEWRSDSATTGSPNSCHPPGSTPNANPAATTTTSRALTWRHT